MFVELAAISGIIVADLALSGDNGLVIGAVAAPFPRRKRTVALLLGGVGAIVIRLSFSLAVTLLLHIPFLRLVGGVVLFWVVFNLRRDRLGVTPDKKKKVQTETLWAAIRLIVLADVTMSLDNILAVGALAHDEPTLLSGMLLSMILMLTGSALISTVMERLPWVLDLAALVLAWTAGSLLVSDPTLLSLVPSWALLGIPASGICLGIGIEVAVRRRLKTERTKARSSSYQVPRGNAHRTGQF